MSKSTDIVQEFLEGRASVEDLTEKDEKKKLSPGMLVLSLLAVGGGYLLWNKIEMFLADLFLRISSEAHYRNYTDRLMHDSLRRVESVLKPKLYPLTTELQREFKQGKLTTLSPRQLEKHIRAKIEDKVRAAEPAITKELENLTLHIKEMIVQNVVDNLVRYLHKESFHA